MSTSKEVRRSLRDAYLKQGGQDLPPKRHSQNTVIEQALSTQHRRGIKQTSWGGGLFSLAVAGEIAYIIFNAHPFRQAPIPMIIVAAIGLALFYYGTRNWHYTTVGARLIAGPSTRHRYECHSVYHDSQDGGGWRNWFMFLHADSDDSHVGTLAIPRDRGRGDAIVWGTPRPGQIVVVVSAGGEVLCSRVGWIKSTRLFRWHAVSAERARNRSLNRQNRRAAGRGTPWS